MERADIASNMFAVPHIAPSGRLLVAVPFAAVLLSAAALSSRELLQKRKWGQVLLGVLRIGTLVSVAVLLLVRHVPRWAALLLLPLGLWAAARPLRKAAIIGLLRIGAFLARRTNRRGVERLRRTGMGLLRAALPLRRLVVRNMRRAGIYRQGLENDYWERAADQMTFLMNILRAGYPDSGVGQRFCFDESQRYLHQAHQVGHGLLVLSPHLCGYPVFARVLADHVPCSIYLRHSPDPSKHALNMLMGQAGGGHLVFPSANGSPAERLNVAMRVLRQKRALYVTPDLPRKASEGVPVTLWDRVVYFPTGVMIMAIRTGAPIVFSTWFYRDGLYHVRFTEPRVLARRGSRKHQAHEGMLAFARIMDRHLRKFPEMWWNWLDKRWTRILRSPPNARAAGDMNCAGSKDV